MFKTINEALKVGRFPTDDELREMAYGVKYFSFGASTLAWTAERRAKLTRMQARLDEIEDKCQPHQTRDTREKCSCGHKTEFPMTTANGTACPRCYDKMSTQ